MGIMKKIQLMREQEVYIPVAFRRFAGIEKPKKVKKDQRLLGITLEKINKIL